MKQEGDTIDVRQNLEDDTVCNIKVCDDKNNTFMFHLKANQPIEKLMKSYCDVKNIQNIRLLRFL
jgi:hypothetical protein